MSRLEIMGPLNKLSQADVAVNYWLLLGVRQDATDREIDDAYKKFRAQQPDEYSASASDKAYQILRTRARHVLLVRRLRREYEQQRRLWDLGAFGSGQGFQVQTMGALDCMLLDLDSPEFCLWIYLNDCCPLGDHNLPPRKLILATYLWASRSLFHEWKQAFRKNVLIDSIPARWNVHPGLIDSYSPLCLEQARNLQEGEAFLFDLPPWKTLLDVVAEHRLFCAFREGERRLWWWCTAALMDRLGRRRCKELEITTLGSECTLGDDEASEFLRRVVWVGKDHAYQLPFAPSMEDVCSALNLSLDDAPHTIFPHHGDKIGEAFADWHARLRCRFYEECIATSRTTKEVIEYFAAFHRSTYATLQPNLFKLMPDVPPLSWRSTWVPSVDIDLSYDCSSRPTSLVTPSSITHASASGAVSDSLAPMDAEAQAAQGSLDPVKLRFALLHVADGQRDDVPRDVANDALALCTSLARKVYSEPKRRIISRHAIPIIKRLLMPISDDDGYSSPELEDDVKINLGGGTQYSSDFAEFDEFIANAGYEAAFDEDCSEAREVVCSGAGDLETVVEEEDEAEELEGTLRANEGRKVTEFTLFHSREAQSAQASSPLAPSTQHPNLDSRHAAKTYHENDLAEELFRAPASDTLRHGRGVTDANLEDTSDSDESDDDPFAVHPPGTHCTTSPFASSA